jgi:hypothetical protein
MIKEALKIPLTINIIIEMLVMINTMKHLIKVHIISTTNLYMDKKIKTITNIKIFNKQIMDT